MAGPRDGHLTNYELGMQIIQNAVHKSREEITGVFDHFYATILSPPKAVHAASRASCPARR